MFQETGSLTETVSASSLELPETTLSEGLAWQMSMKWLFTTISVLFLIGIGVFLAFHRGFDKRQQRNTTADYQGEEVRAEILEYFRAKTVALVGPAQSFEGAGFGPEIDQHDIICRLNYPHYPHAYDNDFGSRTDVLFANLNPENIRLLKKIRERWKNISWLVQTQTGRLSLTPSKGFLKMNIYHVPYYFSPPAGLRKLRKKIGAKPLSGTWALDFLLHTAAKQIDIYGIDFYVSGYYSGRLRTKNQYLVKKSKRQESQRAIIARADRFHDFQANREYFVDHILTDSRFNWVLPNSLKGKMLLNMYDLES